MGKHDYPDDPVVCHDFAAAAKLLIYHMDKSFLTGSSKAVFASHLKAAAKSTALKLARYQLSSKVNMGRVEFLRDVVFLGAALVESGKSGTPYYQALVSAAFDITMAGEDIDFEDSFIKKVSGAKYAYYLGQEFSATGFYLLFKSHFRVSKNT